jgi:hypothetical protein
MRFEANHGGTIYHGIFHGRDDRLQPAAQPAIGVISRMVVFGDRRFLPIIRHRGGGLVHHIFNSRIGGRRLRSVALYHRGNNVFIDDRLIEGVKDLVSLTIHGERSGSGAVCSKWKSNRLEGKSEKRWDVTCSAALSFICVAGDSVMTRFPRKRCPSISTARAIRTQDQEAEKFGSLKYFKVCSI